jgi:hypothetical protein
MATDQEGRRPSFGEARSSGRPATNPRRRAALAATVAIAALLLSACGKDGGTADPGTSPSSGSGAIGGAPNSESATPEASDPVNPTATGPVYPRDARTYSLELLRAWSQSNQSRINQLADSSTIQQIKDSTNAMGVPNGNWTYYACSSGNPKTMCTFFNANGDQADVQVFTAKLGSPNAGAAASLQRTTFAKDTYQYVSDWTLAWAERNYPRMTVYSSAAVTNYFRNRQPITSKNVDPPFTEGGKTYVRISGIGSDLGRSEVVQVDTNKISQGKPGGIIGYKTNP